MTPVLILAATSARMMAQSARRGGIRAIALDVFGDLDTRGAAHWVSIANDRRKDIDAQRMEAALSRLSGHPGILGWVAGGGFEDRLDVMDQCSQALPLIGNGVAAVAAVKDPLNFFRLLDRYGIEHPETTKEPPSYPAGWLSKRVGGTGGWHVRRLQPSAVAGGSCHGASAPREAFPAVDHSHARDDALAIESAPALGNARAPESAPVRGSAPAHGSSYADDHSPSRDVAPFGGWTPTGQDCHVRAGTSRSALQASYYQREVAGVSMSVLFLANAVDVALIGFNRLLFGASGDRPFVFQGAVGPLPLPEAVAGIVRRAAAQITRHVGLLGLNSMDFLLSNGRVCVLEVNARPSATLDLHDDRLRGGLMSAHLTACRARSLPHQEPAGLTPVKGLQVVYATRPYLASRRGRLRLQELGWCHDIGREGTVTGRGEPLCSVSARAQTEAAVIAKLALRARHIEQIHEEENDG
jgi:predicted ATP-grasp superfamily ATP-dependent carboligase